MASSLAFFCWATASLATNSVTTNSAGALVFTNQFGDLNNDTQVDVRDVVLLTHHLNGTMPLVPAFTNRADLNQDSAINTADRAILAGMIACWNTKADEDFDGDDLSNVEEFQSGTKPFTPDSDGDGWLDGWEVTEGTDPLNNTSQPKMMFFAAPPVRVIFPGTYDNAATATGGVTVAYPPVQITFPDLPVEQVADTNGVTVARPPVQVVIPQP